jgi:excisionase family DNA binding protein
MGLKIHNNAVQPVISTQSFEPILTIEQVAERLELKPSTIYELTRRRNRHPLPVLRAGKFLRFRWSEIERWLNESREETA